MFSDCVLSTRSVAAIRTVQRSFLCPAVPRSPRELSRDLWSEHNSELFDVFSTVHHSIGLFLQPTLMHNSITTCMSHYYPRHVSGLDMPILRRNNCTNTASGILALVSGCTLHRLRALSTGVVYSRLRERGYQMLCLCSCSS